MKFRTFRLADYLTQADSFFYAYKTLEDAPLETLHDHDHYEVFWIVSGHGTHWINAYQRDLAPGDLVFIRPTDRHGLESVAADPLTIVNVSVPASTVRHLGARYPELAERFFWSRATLPFHMPLDETQASQLRALESLLRVGERSLARIEGFVLALCTGVLGQALHGEGSVPGWLQKACEQIHRAEHFRRGAAGFVELCGRGHEHVCRSMKRHLGTTPSVYVNQIRMAHSAKELVATERSVAAIAEHCGLDNLSHFYRQFQKAHGMTPAQYRRQYRMDPVRPTI